MRDDWPDLLALPGVAAASERAEHAAAVVHRLPANLRGWPRSAAEASVRAARCSAGLAGAPLALDDVLRDVDGAVSDPRLAGALRVADALGSLLPFWRRAPMQVLARLHVLAAADLVDQADLGWPVITDQSRMSMLTQIVVQGPWSGPVRASVVLIELGVMRPFPQGNGVVARAAARLTAMTCALDPRGLLVPEVALLRRADEAARIQGRYSVGEPAGVAEWLAFGCRIWEDGAREAAGIAAAG